MPCTTVVLLDHASAAALLILTIVLIVSLSLQQVTLTASLFAALTVTSVLSFGRYYVRQCELAGGISTVVEAGGRQIPGGGTQPSSPC